jgi:ankyrin repeat protein
VDCVCRVAWQTDGTTPLFIASQMGHVECVRALLDGGAAIDQARVGCASSMARHCGGYSRGDPWEPCRMHVQLVGLLHSAWWRAWARGDPAHVALEGVGSILMIGCGTRATEVVRSGMICGLIAGHRSMWQASTAAADNW